MRRKLLDLLARQQWCQRYRRALSYTYRKETRVDGTAGLSDTRRGRLLLRHELMQRGWVLQWHVRATQNMWHHIAPGSRRGLDGLLAAGWDAMALVKFVVAVMGGARDGCDVDSFMN